MPPDHDLVNGSANLDDAGSAAGGGLAWHAIDAGQVLHFEGVDAQRGLSSAEAAARTRQSGQACLAGNEPDLDTTARDVPAGPAGHRPRLLRRGHRAGSVRDDQPARGRGAAECHLDDQ